MSCGGGGGGSTPGTPGKVIDGYVQGAWIYIVPVGNTDSTGFIYKSDAPTDGNGNFSFSGISAFLAANSGNTAYKMISIGGTNTATGSPIPSNTIYTAPLGAKVLTPLTTLVMQTATRIAAGATLTQANINQAVAQIAAVSGIEQSQANNVMLNMDSVANATTDANASKALALQIIITQLAVQKVVDSSADNFSKTVDALATKLADTSNTPMNISALATSASLQDPTSQAQASIISESILNTVDQVTAAAQSQSSSNTTSATLMGQMEGQLTANLASNLAGVTGATDVAAVSNAVTNTTTASIIKNNITNLDKTDSVADLTSPAITNYLLHKASEGGIAQLLGIDVLTVPAGNIIVKSVALATGKLSVNKRTGKAVAAIASNPCSGVADSTSIAVSCADVLGADFCANATSGFQASLSCSNNLPNTISIVLTGFSNPIFGSALSGTIAISNNFMTFTGVTDGTTTFNGALGYDSGTSGSLDFAVKNMTVVSPMWNLLTLDSFSRGSIIPAVNGGQSKLNVYISGIGTLVGSNVEEKISMKYERSQDAAKTLDAGQYTDNVTVTLNGQVSQGSEVVTLTNFGLIEQRFYAGSADQDYLYKLSSFSAGSKLATSKYGYAFFTGDSLKYNFDQTYVSGSLTLKTTP
jgi:hypothetical protein